MFNTVERLALWATDLFITIAHDKGKPVARQGRKAKSLPHEQSNVRLSGYRRRSEEEPLLTLKAFGSPTLFSRFSLKVKEETLE